MAAAGKARATALEAGLAAIARLISPGVDERLSQVLQLLSETRDARQAGQGDGR